MTDEQKRKIWELRLQGHTFTQIAERLGVSRNSAKSFCQREACKALQSQSLCAHCGELLKQESGKCPRRFCNEKCRYTYWNAHRGEKNRKKNHTQQCAYCGKEFECYASANRKYCCVDCFNKARWGDAIHEQRSIQT